MLAFGQQRFVAEPVMILTELIAECSLERFFSYLVMARGDMGRYEWTPCICQNSEEKRCPRVSRAVGVNEIVFMALDIL